MKYEAFTNNVKWIISQLVGESLVDFQCKIPQVMEAVGFSLDDLDLVVDPFEFPGVDGVVAVIEYPVDVSAACWQKRSEISA